MNEILVKLLSGGAVIAIAVVIYLLSQAFGMVFFPRQIAEVATFFGFLVFLAALALVLIIAEIIS